MGAMTRVLTNTPGGYRSVWTWCPGCDSLHPWRVPGVNGETPSDGQALWTWDGNAESPTFEPSLLIYDVVHLCEGEHEPVPCATPDVCQGTHVIGHEVDGVLTFRFRDGVPDDAGPAVLSHVTPHTREPASGNCHSFLRAGVWDFLGDSAHHLAGQKVPMVPLPMSWGEDGE